MTPREYRLFTKCLETGLRRGYRRAFKRNDTQCSHHIPAETP